MLGGSGPHQGKSAPPGAETDERYGIVLSERYRIGELLGTGGMGRVYAAEHVLMRKKLAVKVLHKELSLVPEVVTRFKREAMAAANIEHPNVAGATDFGKLPDGSVFLVLEYIRGLGLREAIDVGPLSEPRALHIARQIVSALASAHALDIVHRDLKPENVMLVKKGGDPDFVKVLDFGIAKVPIQELSERGSLRPGQAITKVGMVFGTPEYMAPEQALGQSVDGRADLYSLGIILFEMLAGVRPYASSSQVGILGQQLSSPVPRVSERAPGVDVSDATEQLLQHLLNKESNERPESARAVVERIDAILRASGRPPAKIGRGTVDAASSVMRRLLPNAKARIRAKGASGAPLPPPSVPPRFVAPPPASKRPKPRLAEEPLREPPLAPNFRRDEGDDLPTNLLVNMGEPATQELPVPPNAPAAEIGPGMAGSVSVVDEEFEEIEELDSGVLFEDSPSEVVKPPSTVSSEDAPRHDRALARPSLWQSGVTWIESKRGRLPQSVQSSLVGVPSSGLLAGLLATLGLVLVAGGFITALGPDSEEREPAEPLASSAPPAASVQPDVSATASSSGGEQPAESAPPDELESAKQTGAGALERLAKSYPRDPKVLLELAKAYRLEKKYEQVIAELSHLLEVDTRMRENGEVATLLWQSAQKQESRDAAFALLEGSMEARGADILFDLSTTRGIRADVKARAEMFFRSEAFDRVATPALKVAVLLSAARSCDDKKALLARVRQVGDRRALSSLRQLEATTGCGTRAKDDCYPCLREDNDLAKAIEAVEERVR